MKSLASWRTVSAWLVAAACMAAANASAAADCGSILTRNFTPKWAWITIYDAGKWRHLDWGYVAPFSDREWRSGNYTCGGIYHVRAEVKASEDRTHDPGNPPNIFDTWMQVDMTNGHDLSLRTPMKLGSYQAKLEDWWFDPVRFWWQATSYLAADKMIPIFDRAINNATPLTVVFDAPTLRPGVKKRYCLAPHGHADILVANVAPFGITVTPKTGGCDSPDLGMPLVMGKIDEDGGGAYYGRFQMYPGAAGITYRNMTPAAAEFSTQAGVRCLAPAKSATLPARGTLHGTVRLKTDCASSKVYMEVPFDATVPAGGGVVVEYGLQLI